MNDVMHCTMKRQKLPGRETNLQEQNQHPPVDSFRLFDLFSKPFDLHFPISKFGHGLRTFTLLIKSETLIILIHTALNTGTRAPGGIGL
jgi:hypothetical protein